MKSTISVGGKAGKASQKTKRKDTKAVVTRQVRADFMDVVAGTACKRAAVRASLIDGHFLTVDASAWWKDDLIWATREVRKRFRIPESVLPDRTYVHKIPWRNNIQEIKEMATAWRYRSGTLKARVSLSNHIRNWKEAKHGFEDLRQLIKVSGDWDWFVVSFSVFLSQAFGDIVDSPNTTLERFVWMPHGPQRSGKTKFNEIVITEMYGKDNRTSVANWIKESFTTPAKLFPMGRSDEMSWRTKEQFDMFKDETTSISDRYVNQKHVPEFMAKMRHSHLTTTNYEYAEIVTKFGPQRRIMSFRFERREDIQNYEERLQKAIGMICRAHTEEYFFEPGKVSEYNLTREGGSLGGPFNRMVDVWTWSEDIDKYEGVCLNSFDDPDLIHAGKFSLVLLSGHKLYLEGNRVLEKMPLESDYNNKGFTKHKVYIWLMERFASVVKNLDKETVDYRSINRENIQRFLEMYCVSRYSQKRQATVWFLRKDWKKRFKQWKGIELPEVIEPETIRPSPTTFKWAGLSEEAMVENMVKEECTKLFDTVALSLEGTDYRALADWRREKSSMPWLLRNLTTKDM